MLYVCPSYQLPRGQYADIVNVAIPHDFRQRTYNRHLFLADTNRPTILQVVLELEVCIIDVS